MKKEQLRKKWRRSFVIALTAAMVVNSVVPGTIAYAAEFTAPDSEDEIVQEATQEDSAQAETTDVFGDEETVELFSDNPAEGYAANGTETTDLTFVKHVALDWGMAYRIRIRNIGQEQELLLGMQIHMNYNLKMLLLIMRMCLQMVEFSCAIMLLLCS